MTLKETIQQQASLCIKCGFCLPHCPTYRLSHHEGESPRGRITLMQQLAAGTLSQDKSLQEYLDHCLVCRACESVCPSKVPYGELIDNARDLMQQQQAHPSGIPWILKSTLKFSRRALSFYRLFRLSQMLKVDKLLIHTPILNKTRLAEHVKSLPNLPASAHWKEFYPAIGEKRGAVTLFTGCAENLFDRQTLSDAMQLLQHFGYDVHIPQNHCCGALDLHAGNQATYDEHKRYNCKQLAKNSFPVLSCSSACATTLKEYPDASFVLSDVLAFLDQETLPPHIRFKPLKERIVLHFPCTHSNGLNTTHSTLSWIQRIPKLKITIYDSQNQCCGAAGSHMLRYPERANTLFQPLLETLQSSHATTLLTSNIGCALHATSRLNTGKSSVRIIHPISLLYQQITVKSKKTA